MERDIAAIAAQLGATQLQNEFMARASARLRGINAVMWSAADNCWHDLLLQAAVMGLQASGLVQPGGLLTSLYHSGEQWDAPNAWPPLVHMIIEAAVESGVTNGTALANQLADNWLHANMVAWQATGHMHEKYNGYVPGGIGRGGEYKPQVGFGWSNGVLMALLERKWKRAARET
ncbi:hypothetical protein Vretifemale_15069 [Volvox reticuliferus]|uniref:alpha,alpha-trehalase n=1 Tax=Volvox reticuliferus TaxID=1737510 RepID=A0A8J4FUU3_9CHLO|nr:hypothetical protein Vretifemale_15069 [Volvox reticuliferus]